MDKNMAAMKVYFVFLLVTSLSLFLTMLYMTSMCQTDSWKTEYMDLHQDSCKCNQPNFSKPATTTREPQYTKVHQSSSEWILKWPTNDSRPLRPCSMMPMKLQGRVNLSKSVRTEDVSFSEVVSNVKYGGIYRPKRCQSKEKVAIIIPYRDRQSHLDIIVNYLHNVLQRQQLYYGIYVVEMALPVQFNRGLLANAGFLTARSIGNFSCYIFHDVDLLPLNDRNIYSCGIHPRHFVATSTRFPEGKLPYLDYLGGVIGFTFSQFEKINGFSNLFFGWGGEDDDLAKRILAHNMTIERPESNIGTYMALPHDEDISNPPNPYRTFLINQAKNRMNMDGLNSIQYHRKAIEFRKLYTWILIDCTESEVMASYPLLKADLQLLVRERKQEARSNGNKTMKIIKYRNGVIKSF